MLEQFIKREANVFGDLPQQDRCDVSPLMKWHRGAAASSIAKLLVRTALAHLGETESKQNGRHLTRLEDRNISHRSSYGNVLNSHEFRLKHRLTVLKKHSNHFAQVEIDLIKRFSLRMRARKTGNEANEQTGLRTPLDNRRIDFHGRLRNHMGKLIIVPRSEIGN